ncbi:MAG: ElyC/SanA/YdcF family protein [Candidatus Anammoxibacter sp.]
MFIFKKIASQFFFPVPLVIYILIVAVFLLWFTNKQKTGKILVSIGIVLFLIFSYPGASNALLKHLERQYVTPDLNNLLGAAAQRNDGKRINLIVVLGGGHTSDPDIPLTSRINQYSLVRLIEGIRIHRAIPGSKLLLSGGSVFDPIPDAKIMADVAIAIGVKRDDIIVELESKDTKDQAVIIKSIVEDDNFILVTSASHMPRSMAMFKKLGMNPIPAPTGHRVKTRQTSSPGLFSPNGEDITKAESAFYEYMGLAWAKFRGQI